MTASLPAAAAGKPVEIWFADDTTRRILQMKSRLSFGSLNLYLK